LSLTIETFDFVATSNPTGESAEKNILASVDSMSIMQKGQTNNGLEETSKSQHKKEWNDALSSSTIATTRCTRNPANAG
jgi:hypothetical protein